ncbi:hypothetical protein [Halogranum rubrum]|uniref:hypothetical protein n=1 Tax=Halogranum rubrum TaxID=553466 RepID=UPI000B7E9FF5|nr:hypothetical protein [Halogranum rubrum]
MKESRGADGSKIPIEEIDDVVLPESLTELVETYEAVVQTRDSYIWRWFYSVSQQFQLSCVPSSNHEHALEQKSILTMFVTMLDDLAEHDGDRQTFQEARKIPFPSEHPVSDRDGVDTAFVEFAQQVWEAFETRLQTAPRYEEFVELFRFDFRQVINAIDYSLVTNEHPDASTLGGCEQYDAHNMVVFSYVDVDLMHSPSFERDELVELRDVVWDAQMMARIGNWVTTWERELEEGDFSSGVIVYALQRDIVTVDELRSDDVDEKAELAERIRDHQVEEYFMTEWETRYSSLKSGRVTASSVDIDAFVEGMKMVLTYHLASRGKK